MSIIYIVTSNPGKLKEISYIISKLSPSKFTFQAIDIDAVEIQGTPREVIEAKAHYVASQTPLRPLLLEDTSLKFNALNGLPGPYIKDFLKYLETDGLWRLIRTYPEQSATASTLFALVTVNGTHIIQGDVPGEIVEPRGERGFGWDAIFKPDGSNLTYAQMPEAEKLARFSSRTEAVKNMLNQYSTRVIQQVFGDRPFY